MFPNCTSLYVYLITSVLYSMHLGFIRSGRPQSTEMEIERCHTLEFQQWFKFKVSDVDHSHFTYGFHPRVFIFVMITHMHHVM